VALPRPRQGVHDVHGDIPDDVELGQEPERAQFTNTWSVRQCKCVACYIKCVLGRAFINMYKWVSISMYVYICVRKCTCRLVRCTALGFACLDVLVLCNAVMDVSLVGSVFRGTSRFCGPEPSVGAVRVLGRQPLPKPSPFSAVYLRRRLRLEGTPMTHLVMGAGALGLSWVISIPVQQDALARENTTGVLE
jgi:hypothetical protein